MWNILFPLLTKEGLRGWFAVGSPSFQEGVGGVADIKTDNTSASPSPGRTQPSGWSLSLPLGKREITPICIH